MLHSLSRNMSDANAPDSAPDSSIVEKLKKLLTKYGTELLKPYVFHEELFRRLDVSFKFPCPEFFFLHMFFT